MKRKELSNVVQLRLDFNDMRLILLLKRKITRNMGGNL